MIIGVIIFSPFLLTDIGSPSLSTATREHVASKPTPPTAEDGILSVISYIYVFESNLYMYKKD